MAARRVALLILGLLWQAAALGHEMRPAYVSLEEESDGVYTVEFRQPVIGGRSFDLQLQLGCDYLTSPVSAGAGDNIVQRWKADCTGGINHIAVAGLSETPIDVLVSIKHADGSAETHVMTADAPLLDLAPGSYPGLPAYMVLGIQHLLEGLDHVLFVIGLILLVKGPWRIVKTITSFTVAHSLTLALSSLDLVRLSQGPVEAAIALSLLFVAAENVTPDRDRTLTARHPWQIAFAFGLLHGLGFAGVLREIGMPDDQLVGALFLFNVGIEIGQLIVVAALLLLMALWRRTSAALDMPAMQGYAMRLVPIYAIGTISSYWVIERVVKLI